MDLTFLLAGMNRESLKLLRKEVQDLAALQDFTYRMFTASLPGAWEKIAVRDWEMLSLALVHVEHPDAERLGLHIYAANPFCRLIYFGRGMYDIVPMLPSRPVRYLDMNAGTDRIRECLWEEYCSLLREKRCFHYEDRYQALILPFSAITYFFSRDRAVYCQTVCGEQGPLRRTLDGIEKELRTGVFLRCHKSYLVRRDICVMLDKSTRELVLKSGERLPVSRSCWNATARYVMSKC